MKLCTTAVVTGYDQKPHYAIVSIGEPGWPIALMGFSTGPNAAESKAEAEFFADAPAMFDMIEHLAKQFDSLTLNGSITPGQLAQLDVLTERAAALAKKHAKVR